MDNFRNYGRTNSLDTRQRRQERIDAAALPVIFERYSLAPYATYQDVADALNARGIKGPRERWTISSVRRVILRHGLTSYARYQRAYMRRSEIEAAQTTDRKRVDAWVNEIEARA